MPSRQLLSRSAQRTLRQNWLASCKISSKYYKERLKNLENASQKGELAEQEKTRLETEKSELRQQLAELQTKFEAANRQKQTERARRPPVVSDAPPTADDNSLVTVNTPIYDVFPSDSIVRGKIGEAKIKLTIPRNAKNAVLILNDEAPNEIKISQGELVNGAGKIVWRGT